MTMSNIHTHTQITVKARMFRKCTTTTTIIFTRKRQKAVNQNVFPCKGER
jgi:hypothetical protein